MDAKKTVKTLLTAAIVTGGIAACNNGSTATTNNDTVATNETKKTAPKKDVTPKKDTDEVYDKLVKDAAERTGLNFNDKGPEIFGIANEITVPMGTTMDDLLYGVYALDADGNEVEVKLETSLVSFLKAGKYQTYLTAVDKDGNATLYPVNITILPGKKQTTPVNPAEPQPMVAAISDEQVSEIPEVTQVVTGTTDTGNTSDKSESTHTISDEEKALKKALQEAKTKLSNAEKAVVNAAADLAKKENALKKAEKALEDAKANVTSTAEDITRAEANLAAKKQAYADAEKARVDAYNAYMKAVNDATNSPEFQAAVDAVNAKNEALVDAMGVAASALAQFDAATSAVETAQSVVNEKEQALNDAKTALADAKSDKDASDAKVQELENAVAEKKKDLDDAVAVLATAQEAYDAVALQLTESPEYQAAVAATEASNNEMLTAIGAAAETATVVNETKTALDEAKTAKAEKDAILAEKQAAAEQAEKALDEAIEKADELRHASREAGKATEAAEQELADLEAQIETARQNKTSIEADINETLAEMEGYDQAIEDARAAYEQAAAAYKEAKKQVAKGSIGFFQEREAEQGATASIDDLLNESIKNALAAGNVDKGITHVGAEGDATSLENMKLAVSYLHECNELRASDDNNSGVDKEPLVVSDILMLGAQVEANFAAEQYKHNTLFNGDWNGQILARMYNDQDPYYAWYTKEKKVYDEGRSGTTGHYKIIANPDGSTLYRYTATGIGVNSVGGEENSNAKTWMQNFVMKSSYKAATYSVDEYEAAFLEYYDRVMGAVNTAQAAMDDAKNAYIASINANTGMSDEEKASLIVSAEAMFDNAAQIDDVGEKIAQFTSLYESAVVASDSFTATLEADQATLDETLANLPDAQRAAYDTFVEKYDRVREIEAVMYTVTGDERANYKQEYDELVAEINTICDENNLWTVTDLYAKTITDENTIASTNLFIADLEGKLADLNNQKAALEDELTGLQAQYGVDLLASGATAEEKAKVEQLTAELAAVNTSIDNLSTAIEAGTQAVEDCKAAQEKAADAAEDAVTEVNALSIEAQNASAEAESAKIDADNAAADVTTAEEAYNSAKAAKDEADQTVEEKKAAYEAAKANADEVARQINENVDAAKAAVDDASAKAEEAKKEYDYLLTLSNEAIADNEAAGAALEEAKSNVENAEAALESAQADLTTAQTDAESKKAVLDQANADAEKAQAEYDDAVAKADDIKAEIDANVAEQKAAYEAAENAESAAGEEVLEANAAVTDATIAHDNAVQAVETAEKAVETAETAKAEAEVVLETAVEAREIAQDNYNEIKEVYDYYKENGEMPAVQAPVEQMPINNKVPYETEQVTENTTYNAVENEVVITETPAPDAAPATQEAAPEATPATTQEETPAPVEEQPATEEVNG